MAGTVTATPEFRRVLDLPVHDRSEEHWAELALMLTEATKTPRGSMTLRPIQGQICAEAHDAGGLFAMAPVGSGKTIPSFLIPEIMGAQRPVLMIKAALRAKTIEDRRDIAQHFRIHDGIKILTYDMLSQPHARDLLEALNPDLIVADEAQALKNLSAARTRRFMRFMAEKEIPFVALSGTMTRKALRDYWHLISLALPDGGSPLPYSEGVLEQWGLALDSKVDPLARLRPGALLQFAEAFDVPKDSNPLTRARAGFNRRLISTLGVVSTSVSSCDKPLTIRARHVETPPLIKDALKHLRNTWEAPNGDECESKLEIWRHARELACGFYSVWDPPAPEDWLAARKAWHSFVREILSRDDPRLDSPFLIANAYDDHPLHVAWKEIRDTFEPNSVPVWIDNFLIDDAAQWLIESRAHGGGIAWTEHVTVGERLAKAAGVRYYGGGPIAARDIGRARGPIVCSIQAHSVGRNLQRYTRNLVVSPPPSGATWEQLAGRTHRFGQDQAVELEVYQHCPELREGMETAIEDAQYIQQTTGIDQKLLISSLDGIAMAC